MDFFNLMDAKKRPAICRPLFIFLNFSFVKSNETLSKTIFIKMV